MTLGCVTLSRSLLPLRSLPLPILESFAAKICLSQTALLDHGAHRAVKNDDALAQQARQFLCFVQFSAHVLKNQPAWAETSDTSPIPSFCGQNTRKLPGDQL